MLSQKQEILIAESLSASVDTGASRCENFGNQPLLGPRKRRKEQ